MAEPIETPKTPAWKQAKTWDEYFNTDKDEKGIPTEKDVRITNSTGYQLYAVNEDTIVTDFKKFNKVENDRFVSGTLNLQLADAAYNEKDSFLTGDYRDAIPFRKISPNSKISKSFLMSNNDFKFNETIGTNLGKNLNIQSIVINEYQQEQRAFNGTLIDQLINIVSKRIARS